MSSHISNNYVMSMRNYNCNKCEVDYCLTFSKEHNQCGYDITCTLIVVDVTVPTGRVV